MKIITAIGAFLLFTQTGLAQPIEDNTEEKYRIKIVKKENGKETVTDQTFATRQAMDEFISKNQLDLPEGPPSPPNLTADTKCRKEIKECRKTVIIEKEERKDKK